MAGAGYKLFNTGDVLTAAQVNTYLQEQVVMVFNDATARTTALSGVLAEGMVSYLKDTNATEVYDGSAWVGIGNSGDITGVTAGTGISGGGTSGTVTITNSMATEITAAGDIIVGTGSGTFDNLPIGTTGQVLTADTTVSPYKVKWATASATSALTLISSTTFTASSSHSVNDVFSSTYDNYLILISTDSASAGSHNYIRLRVSGADNTSSNYYWSNMYNQSGSATPSGENSAGLTTAWQTYYSEAASTYAYTIVNLGNPNRTANTTMFFEHNRYNTNSTNQRGSGTLSVTTAYTGFTIYPASGNITGKVRVYGYQNS